MELFWGKVHTFCNPAEFLLLGRSQFVNDVLGTRRRGSELLQNGNVPSIIIAGFAISRTSPPPWESSPGTLAASYCRPLAPFVQRPFTFWGGVIIGGGGGGWFRAVLHPWL